MRARPEMSASVRRRRLLASLALLLLLALPPPSAGQYSSLVLLADYDIRYYSPGETVNIILYTFSAGERVSPDAPPLLTVTPRDGASRDIPVQEASPGKYKAAYTVLASDAMYWSEIYLSASATRGRTSEVDPDYDTATTSLFIELAPLPGGEGALRVSGFVREASDSPLRPGSRVVVECDVLNGSLPADPEGLRFALYQNYPEGTGAGRTPLEAEREASGRYILRCTIPKQKYSDSFSVVAFHPDLGTYGQQTVATFDLDFFTVLFHQLKVCGTRVDFELLVSDRAGKPVNGTTVSLQLDPYGRPAQNVALETDRTDRNGRTRAFMDFGPDIGTVSMSGWANASGQLQRFYASIRFPWGQTSSYPGSSFQMMSTATSGERRPGGSLNITYTASLNGKPLHNHPVDCYILTHELDLYTPADQQSFKPATVDGFRTITNDAGEFEVKFSFPAGPGTHAELQFRSPTGPSVADAYNPLSEDGLAYSTDSDNIYALPEQTAPPAAEAVLSALYPGAACRLKATPLYNDTVAVRVSWEVAQPGNSSTVSWDSWNRLEWSLKPVNGSKEFRGGVAIPGNLKVGTNITFTIDAYSRNGSMSRTTLTRTLKAAPAAPVESADICCFVGIAILNFVLIGFMVASYLLGRRAPRQRTLAEMGADEALQMLAKEQLPGSYPAKAELIESIECAVCARKIARGNVAYRCSCGRGFHEHCLGVGDKCPSCGREWSKR